MNDESPRPDNLVVCSRCGHSVPETNLELHRAACNSQHNHHPHQMREEALQMREEALQADETSPSVPTVQCEKCGRHIPSMNLMVHLASCHKGEEPEPSHQASENTSPFEKSKEEASKLTTRQLKRKLRDLGIETRGMVERSELVEAYARAVAKSEANAHTVDVSDVQLIEQEEAIETAIGYPENHERVASPDTNSTTAPAESEQQWACPRCTLLNPISSNQCEVCLHNRNHHHVNNPNNNSLRDPRLPQQQQQEQEQNGGVNVQVSEVDPRVVDAVGSATTVASLGILGALIGGPVGALVGGATGATIDGMTRFNNHRLEQAGRPRPGPRFVFTTVSRGPSGTTTSVTSNNNNGGGIRTVRISGSSLDQMTPTDRQIMQMLLLNAMSQGAQHADQLSYDELLERFGVGTERRGASSQAIDALPLTTMDTNNLQELQENQKCCNICLEEFKEGDQARKLSCDHVFHQQCIDRWLSQVASCPICKKEIEGATGSSERHGNPSSAAHARPFWA